MIEAAAEYRTQWQQAVLCTGALAALGDTMHACLSVYKNWLVVSVRTSVDCYMLLLYCSSFYCVGVVCYSTHGVVRQGQDICCCY
jgi:hypothetical protein